MSRSQFLTEFHSAFGLPRSAVIGLAEQATHRRVVDLERVVRGDENEVYRTHLDDDTTVFCRIRLPGDRAMDLECWAMEQARQAGVPVPEVFSATILTTDEGDREAMVVAEAPGRQLLTVLSSLTREQRRIVMLGIGSSLARLHSVRVPGFGRPNDEGKWPEPTSRRQPEAKDRESDRRNLLSAGLSSAEVDDAFKLLDLPGDEAAGCDPVLCHADISPEHVFVDDALRVSAIIDWGLWSGDVPLVDLAWIAMNEPEPDFVDVLEGYGRYDVHDRDFSRAISRLIVGRAIGAIGWNILIGNDDAVLQKLAALRKALAAAH